MGSLQKAHGLLRSVFVLVIWGNGTVSGGLLHNAHGVFRAALASMVRGNSASFDRASPDATSGKM